MLNLLLNMENKKNVLVGLCTYEDKRNMVRGERQTIKERDFISYVVQAFFFPLGHHECEVLGRRPEAAESVSCWDRCKKNPGHEEFISVQNFTEKHLPTLLSVKQREMLKMAVVRTVRLRVQWTSLERPGEDDLAEYRGTDRLRLGTGFIRHVSEAKLDKSCPCLECDGKILRKYWTFTVQTARHVVYNTEEAKTTRVDLFYDDKDSRQDGRMKSVWAVEVKWISPGMDICVMLCVTHDETVAQKVSLSSVLEGEQHNLSRATVEHTVRLTIEWTSLDRSTDDLSEFRGTDRIREGTGFIRHVEENELGKPCPCHDCDGKTSRKHWTLTVQTACHVIFNAEEAKRTTVHFYYNNKRCDPEGRVKAEKTVDVVWSDPDVDFCIISCVTHDKTLAEKINSLNSSQRSLFQWRPNTVYPHARKGRVVIVSHPHGQPKKITVGKCSHWGDISKGDFCFEYHTATCSGSSGAPVLLINCTSSLLDQEFIRWRGLVHNGTYNKTCAKLKDQVNYSSSLGLLYKKTSLNNK